MKLIRDTDHDAARDARPERHIPASRRNWPRAAQMVAVITEEATLEVMSTAVVSAP
jgi:hypothetical protein